MMPICTLGLGVLVEQWLRSFALASYVAGSIPQYCGVSSDPKYENRLCIPRTDTDKNEFRDLAHET